MIKNIPSILLYLIIDCFLLIVSFNQISSLMNRSTFPFSIKEESGTFVIDNITNVLTTSSLSVGDTIVTINDSIITISEQLEFISDNAAIGSIHKLTTKKNGSNVSLFFSTVSYYPSLLYIVIILFIGITFFTVGIFVVWSKPQDGIAHLFHWMMVLVGTVIMITWGSLESKELFTIFIRGLFFFSYAVGIASFYLFTKLYCAPTPRFMNERIILVYTAAFIFSGTLIYYHLRAIETQSLSIYAQFQQYFDLFHIVLFVAFIAGIINIISAYKKTDSPDERNRLEWIIWGFAISSTPFLLFYILPQILVSRYIIAEEYTTIFFIALPFSFGVSFIKHHLFDIRLLIKRTIVNFMFSAIIAVTYFIIVILAAAIINKTILSSENFIIVVLTLIIAMAFNPVRSRLKTFVDRLLFKAHGEYRMIQFEISQRLQSSISVEEIFAVVLETIQSSLPVEQCVIYRQENGYLLKNDRMNEAQPIKIESIKFILPHRAAAIRNIVRTENREAILIDNAMKSRIGYELFVLINNAQTSILGAIGLNRITTKEQFDTEEISLLLMICDRATEHLERLALQETMFREKEDRKRADELNKLKSDFVSYVSHELQTPLTSIRMFSELLQKNISGKKGKEQLEIIAGESDRLSRMVNNLLDGSRIENGLMVYHFENCTLNEIIDTVIKNMSYLIKKHGFRLHYSVSRSVDIWADKEAIEQAVMNLVSNAVKYSRTKKNIDIRITKRNGYAICSIQDHGDGIAKKDIPFLFDRFYRLPEHHNTVKGVGLGLSLVKHIIDAHQGKVAVRSSLGKGSTFLLFIPLKKK